MNPARHDPAGPDSPGPDPDGPTPPGTTLADPGTGRRTWAVVPMFDEATVVGDVIRALRVVFPHVVCVDDASRDGSAAIAERAGAVVVRHPLNLGQGAALQTGISFALRDPRTTSVLTFDADGQHGVTDARAMVEVLEADGLGFVLGSRFLAPGNAKPPPLKRVVLRLAVRHTTMTTGMRLTDTHNGLRVLSREAAAGVALRQNRMAHASELVAQLGRSGLPWREHPVDIAYTEYSRSKGQSVFNSVNVLTELMHR